MTNDRISQSRNAPGRGRHTLLTMGKNYLFPSGTPEQVGRLPTYLLLFLFISTI